MNTVTRQDSNPSYRVIGMDIHPESFTASALDARTGEVLWTKGKILYDQLKGWLWKNCEQHDLFVIEAGSNSFETVKRIKNAGGQAIVLETFRAGQIKKAYLKNDALDSVKLAKIYLSGLSREVWVPDETTRERRELLSGYLNTVKDASRNRCRLWAYLNGHGLHQPNGVNLTKENGFTWLMKQRDWSHSQELVIRSYIEKIRSAEGMRKAFKRQIGWEVSEDPQILKLFRLLGVSLINSFAIAAIIGDVNRFRTPKKLVAYIGLQPKVEQSGKMSRTSVTLGYGRRELRSLLVQSAHAILRSAPNDLPIARWGRRKEFQKGKQKAVIAVARKLVVAIWYLLKGFYTNLEEVSETIRTKLLKTGFAIGTELRRVMGYQKMEDFIEAKSKLLLSTA